MVEFILPLTGILYITLAFIQLYCVKGYIMGIVEPFFTMVDESNFSFHKTNIMDKETTLSLYMSMQVISSTSGLKYSLKVMVR